MITIDEIGWGTYMEYEGPYYRGNQPYVLPENPSPEQIYLSVITATEGGSANAVNMYDRCGVSLGWIQWCEFGQFSVSALLGYASTEVLLNLPAATTYHLSPTPSGWRFKTSTGDVIDTIDKQRRMFFLNASGEQGSWDDESKLYAKTWAVALAQVFENEAAKKTQLDYTTARLDKFVLPAARQLKPDGIANPWVFVAYAAYLSFAANNPTIASRMFEVYNKDTPFRPFNKDWVIGLLKQLTFGPQIAIYPARYNAIRPVLEKNFGVDLPDFATELRAWQQGAGIEPSDPDEYKMDTTTAIQSALITLGYDLGPSKADGVFGNKTRQAVITFQKQHFLSSTGVVDLATRRALVGALEQRNS